MKIFNKKILYSIFLLIFIGSIFIAIPQPARAEIPVIAPTTDAILLGKTIKDTANTVKEWTWRALVEQLQKMGAQAFSTALRSAMQKIAYDSATWLGSGGHGQKPMFITEGWGPYLNNIADDTAGTFIEEIGKTGISGVKFNLCEPNLSVKISVGLGLIEYQRPSPPACTFSKMRDNWEQALEDPQFLNKFQDMFNPTSNDLGYSLIMYQKMIEQKEKQTGLGVYGRLASGGWLNISPIIESGNSVAGSLVGAHSSSYPQYAAAVATLPWTIAEEALGKDFGNSLVNATNVFLNQYFLTLLRTKLSQIGRGAPSYTSPYSGNYGGLTKAEANPSNGGIQAAKEKLKKIIEPNFTEKADYNILVELTSCPNPVKAGPTNCVISEKFSQAVQLKKTVGEAMKDGYLDPNGIFGFTSNGQEPDYKQGYPYRSMIILRKYRILPVGWELAAQYIKDKAMNESGSGETLNLKDLVDCFDPSDDNYVGYAANWCQGLVDPNWVLKAPQNYCKRQGAGPEILSSEVTTKTEENGDTSPRKWNELMISRNETYCGDEQSCIKENKDGSCKLYGYCIEDKRKWKFDSDSCDSIYNTCMTFSNSQDNSSISYLQNTLDYANCSADNAGCQAYCEDYNYASSRYTCTADAGNKIYLDRDVVECDASNEGCHEFIRTKEGLGANLLLNGGFENDTVGSSVTAAAITYLGDWQLSGSDATIVDSSTGQVHSGNQSLHIAANADSGLEPLIVGAAVHPVVPVDLRLAEGEVLTLSVWVYPISGSVMLALGNSATTWVRATSTVTNQWEKLKVTLVNSGINTNQFLVYADGAAATFYVDDIQLEKGQSATAYSSYRQRGLVYEKLLPAYLYSACYSDSVSGNYSLRANHPAICDNYVRLCNQDEAGCEMYTGVVDKISVPAKITTDDKCPQVCVGYDQYLQAETYFDSARTALFIPQLGTKCSAEMAGCDEFTNLDKLAQGGESREYYTYIRQCIKPGDSCAEFYTWEGSDETGYQLKVHSLQNGAGNSPFVTSDDSGECNVDIYNYAPDEPGYNADCTEFYNRAGDISYHLYTRTISCSDDCHPYRRTEKNTDPSITESVCGANCSAADGATTCWDSATGACNFCRNNGTWSVQHQACIYMAIPSEGRVCSAAMAGCREFSGNSGSNMRIVVNSNFEGSTEGWTGNFDPATNPSNEALRLGGHSLNVNQVGHTIHLNLGQTINQGSAYYLEFWSEATSDFNVSLNNGTDNAAFTSATLLGNSSWNIYKFNLDNLNHNVTDAEELIISSPAGYYIDNIRLVEITDRYYLLKNSLHVPDACNFDVLGVWRGAGFNLGCKAYTDRDNKTNYLHKFTGLCQDSAVGCEQVIDTSNSKSYSQEGWNDGGDGSCAGDGQDCKIVLADHFIYAVYDKNKTCNEADKGCQRLGRIANYEDNLTFTDVYYKNNPDNYNKIMCSEEAEGCQEWQANDSLTYFRDPGDQVCEWRQMQKTGAQGWDWFKKRVKRCDVNNNSVIDDPEIDLVCKDDSDCAKIAATTTKCILDANDRPCTIDYYKTIGYGGTNMRVEQPGIESSDWWAGICPAEQTGCTEYIEPISDFSANTILNPSFIDIDGNGANNDHWQDLGAGLGFRQMLAIQPYALYRLSIATDPDDSTRLANRVTLTCDNIIYILDSTTNELTSLGSNNYTVIIPGGAQVASAMIYSDSNSNCEVAVNAAAHDVQLKPAIVDYQMKLDKNNECNGRVSKEESCILFNERAQNGRAKAILTYDADNSPDVTNGPVACAGTTCNSNLILKVTPDRDCAKWLACRNYVKDKNGKISCYDLGLCESVDTKGECNGFVVTQGGPTNQTYPTYLSASNISNLTGYAKVGYEISATATTLGLNDLYKTSLMQQAGGAAIDFNGGFEEYSEIGNDTSGSVVFRPLLWDSYVTGTWNPNNMAVVNDPVVIQNAHVSYRQNGYAPEGKAVLRFNSSAGTSTAYSGFVSVIPNTDYILGIYINTSALATNDNNYLVTANVDLDAFSFERGLITTNAIRQVDTGAITRTVISAPAGRDWIRYVVRFRTGSEVANIRIMLDGYTNGVGQCGVAGNAHCQGQIYVDDIEIMPALITKDLSPTVDDYNYWYELQSCRLFPKNDAPACDYKEESGIEYKGWWGYCLEHDRYPGDPNACLLWYPVDRTKGNSTGDEMLSYEGRYPLYYAVRVGLQPVDASTDTVNGGCGLCWCACSPSGENCNDSSMDGGLPRGMHFTVDDLSIPSYFRQFLNKNFITSISFEGGRGSIDSSDAVGNDWCSAEMHDCGDGNCGNVSRATFDAAGNLTGMIAMRCDTSGDGDENRLDYSATVHLRVPFASRIVQVIDNVGNGSVWRQRIAANSNYFTICNDPANPANTFHCVYDSDYYPFGAVVGPVGEPPTWDSKPDGPTNNQPLYFEATSGTTPPYQFRAGQLHTNTDYLERLFTFPFASWSWSWIGGGTTHGQYNNDGSVTWDPPTAVCPSNPAGQPVRPVFNPAAATMPLQCIGLSGSSGNCLTCPGSTCDYCVVPPVVSNIHVNGKTSNIVISQSQSANLTFNSQVDAEQQPLEYVDIDWGDGDTHTEITGANLRDRPDETDPHSFYNVYNYVDIINRHVASGITCGSNCYGDGYCSRPDENVAYCLVKPRVRIQDNWGWFNTGGYIAYGNEVVVKGY